MKQPADFTAVRFSMRSLLALTFGFSIVFAVTGPFIRDLNPEQQNRLWVSIGLILLSAAGNTFFMVRRRIVQDKKCGAILYQAVLFQRPRPAGWRWLMLLYGAPVFVYLVYICLGILFERQSFEELSVDSFFAVLSAKPFGIMLGFLFLPWCYGHSMAKHGLMYWTEGFADTISLREEGILLPDKMFHEWCSKKLRGFEWGSWGERSDMWMININRMTSYFDLAPGQREQIDAVLDEYYWKQGSELHVQAESTAQVANQPGG